MHTLQYTPLSNLTKELLDKKVDVFSNEKDIYNEALYHSGVPYIETVINEHIHKCILN